MKKFTAYFLLSLFTFNAIGFYLVFGLQLYAIKAEVQQEITGGNFAEELVQITVSLENEGELDWKDSSEFLYRGQMYDVVSKSHEAYTTVYTCKKDSEEKDLFDAFEKQLKKNNKRNKRNHKTDKNLKKVFFKKLTVYASSTPSIQEVRKMSFLKDILYHSPSISVTSPPPRLI